MAEERVVEVQHPNGNTTTHTTVYDSPRSGGGAGWLIAVILVIAVVAGVYFISGMSSSQTAKDNAIAGAAKDVGKAATNIGKAAGTAADKVDKTTTDSGN
jgi:hypothetical protein